MAGFSMLRPGLLTYGEGLALLVFSFRINGTSNPDFIWQAQANAVVSVTRDSEGIFTVQLNEPYPRQLVAGFAQLHLAAGDVADNDVYIVRDTFSNSTGQFKVIVKEDGGGDGAGEVSDPEDNDVISVACYFQTSNILVES